MDWPRCGLPYWPYASEASARDWVGLQKVTFSGLVVMGGIFVIVDLIAAFDT